jgi:sugar phosphate isomerase/epimerase
MDQKRKDDISLAQWALVEEIRAGNWKTTDFARVAREDFGLNGIEFVNTLFESPTETYLKKLKHAAEIYGVTMVLIMVDEEGDGCAPTKQGQREFAMFHRKWVDIAHYLGCSAIRTNCRGPEGIDSEEALDWATESYKLLLDYARPSGVNILIENHGGVSNDAAWMLRLIDRLSDPLFGTLPDWREPGTTFDHIGYLQQMAPYAKGMSVRNQPTEEETAKMIQTCKESGYKGWYGVESKGRDEVRKGIELLRKYL